ncbi:hypothetical protein SLUN_38265 [Streptomyces lunaelactis]|uniref:Uncharacterized protein n=1 Tax=Streptomyces lunaelactis TaxID=1535768 RepID=A0A2R4TDD7_9ACTN|nr:hypothetical protein SLUN_38265 [Streptomyces lunaelactis]
MEPEGQAVIADGPLPDWDAGEGEIDRRVAQLHAILRPTCCPESGVNRANRLEFELNGVARDRRCQIEQLAHRVDAREPAPAAAHEVRARAVHDEGPGGADAGCGVP